MKKILALVLAAALVLALVPMTAMAAGITVYVNYDSEKSSLDNGKALWNAIMTAPDGSTVKVGPGEFTLTDGQTSRITGKSITLEGSPDNPTILTGETKYALVIQSKDPDHIVEFTIKNLTMKAPMHPLYAKNSIVNLENVTLTGLGPVALLVDSGNVFQNGEYRDGIESVVNCKNVTIDAGDKVQFQTLPLNTADTENYNTYTKFTFDESCTNISESICEAQSGVRGFENMYVNGEVFNWVTGPADQYVKPGETATFSVSAGDVVTITGYQWYVDRQDGNDFVEISGATSASYTTDPVVLENNGFQYMCIVNGNYQTDAATLHVNVDAPIPETGDGMGLFGFAGLAIISMLGMAVMKKREF